MGSTKINELAEKYSWLLAIIISAIIAALVYEPFLFGSGFFVYLDIGADTADAYIPHYFDFTSSIKNSEIAWWSHSAGLGAPYLSRTSLVFDPFTIFFYIFPKEHLFDTLAYIAVAKSIICGLVLERTLSVMGASVLPRLIGVCLIVVNGYLSLWGQHYYFGTGMFYLMLMVFSIELFLIRRIMTPLFLTSFLVGIFSFYFLFMICAFIPFYVWARGVMMDIKLKNLIDTQLKIVALIGLGVLLASPVLFIYLDFFLSSARNETADISALSIFSIEYYVSLILRLISNDALGTGSQFFGFINYYESPIVYCGIISLILLPQLFYCCSPQVKKGAVILLLWFLVVMSTPIGASSMVAFAKAETFRHSFIVVYTFVLLSIVALQGVLSKGFSMKIALTTITTMTLCLGVSIWLGQTQLDWQTTEFDWSRKYVTRFVFASIIYTAILHCIGNSSHKSLAMCVALMLVGIETTEMAKSSIHRKGVATTEYFNAADDLYFTESVEAVNWLKEYDSSFYRIEKVHWDRSLNDAQVQNYHGTRNYSSLVSRGISDFLLYMGFSGFKKYFWFPDITQHLGLTSYLGIKYLVQDKQHPSPEGYKTIKTFGNLSVYENLNSFPITSFYDTAISSGVFKKMSNLQRELSLVETISLENLQIESEDLKLRNQYSADEAIHKIERQKGSLQIDISPMDTDREIVFIDWLIPRNIGLKEMKVIWGLGPDAIGSVTVERQPRQQRHTRMIQNNGVIDWIRLETGASTILQDIEIRSLANKKLRNRVSENKAFLKELEEVTPNLIVSKVFAQRDGFLSIALPFDSSWSVRINGEKKNLLKSNFGFSAVEIDAGLNTIELEYFPRTLLVSIILALVGLFLFILFRRRFRRKNDLLNQ